MKFYLNNSVSFRIFYNPFRLEIESLFSFESSGTRELTIFNGVFLFQREFFSHEIYFSLWVLKNSELRDLPARIYLSYEPDSLFLPDVVKFYSKNVIDALMCVEPEMRKSTSIFALYVQILCKDKILPMKIVRDSFETAPDPWEIFYGVVSDSSEVEKKFLNETRIRIEIDFSLQIGDKIDGLTIKHINHNPQDRSTLLIVNRPNESYIVTYGGLIVYIEPHARGSHFNSGGDLLFFNKF